MLITRRLQARNEKRAKLYQELMYSEKERKTAQDESLGKPTSTKKGAPRKATTKKQSSKRTGGRSKG